MTAPSLDRDTILQAITEWPIEDQVMLAQLILRRIADQWVSAKLPAGGLNKERSSWDALYGTASNQQAPPTDEQVAQWLDEHRMEKYGR